MAQHLQATDNIKSVMKSKYIYSESDSYQPYVYRLVLSKGEETVYYIGSRSSKRTNAHPNELLRGEYNSSSGVVKKLLEEGWQCKREILETFEGSVDGAIQCGLRESELLQEVNAKNNPLYVNEHNAGTSPGSHSEGHKQKISEAHKGREHSAETKRKISKALKGREHSAETKRKISAAMKGKPSPKRGKPWSPARRAAQEAKKAQKKKVSEAMKVKKTWK